MTVLNILSVLNMILNVIIDINYIKMIITKYFDKLYTNKKFYKIDKFHRNYQNYKNFKMFRTKYVIKISK